MSWKLTWLFLGFVLVFSECYILGPNVKTIQVEVRQMGGGSCSLEDARMGAIALARWEVLEKAGVFLENLIVLPEIELDKPMSFALANGLFRMHLYKERTFTEKGVKGVLVKARIRMELTTLEDKARKLLRQRQHLARLYEVHRRANELLEEFKVLQAENERLSTGATAEERKALRVAFQNNTNKLNAYDWSCKVLHLWDGRYYVPARKAIDYFTRAISFDSTYVFAYTGRGLVYKDQKQYQLALADYDKVIYYAPNLAYVYNDRGAVYAELGQYERAIEDYNHALRLAPDLVLVYSNRGVAYFRLGDIDRAIQDYDQTIRLGPANANAYNNRGAAYYKLKQYERAIGDYDQGIRIDPGNAVTYNNRGSAYAYLGEHQRAIEDYNQAIELDPDVAKVYNNRGNEYVSLEEYELAMLDYNRAINLSLGSLPAYYTNRGWAYYKMGDMRKAIEDYTTALVKHESGHPDLAFIYYVRGLANQTLTFWGLAMLDIKTACELGYQKACDLLLENEEK